uniref:Uncharacterized protein n=1 Tax=Lygus hesperus TaxID=30085 RepID=A0A146M7F1_LYGHE
MANSRRASVGEWYSCSNGGGCTKLPMYEYFGVFHAVYVSSRRSEYYSPPLLSLLTFNGTDGTTISLLSTPPLDGLYTYNLLASMDLTARWVFVYSCCSGARGDDISSVILNYCATPSSENH